MAQAYGFLPTSLGPHILRTETAAIAIASIIRYSLGKLEPQGPHE
jgi:RsmE family RNA methyltransferase